MRIDTMAESKIPEEIKQYRPGPCTEIYLMVVFDTSPVGASSPEVA